MGFFSFFGRVLFASIFILSAWQMYNEFGSDGGPAAKEFQPKLALFHKLVASKVGMVGKNLPKVDVRQMIAIFIFFKGFGGILFVLGSSLGALFLMFVLLVTTPILHDFYNYDFGEPEFMQIFQEFLQGAALFGALLFFMGMRNGIPRKQLKRKNPKSKTV